MKRLVWLVMLVMVLLVVGCGGGGVDNPEEYREVHVSLQDMKFVPEQFEFKKGEKIKFVLTNDGMNIHEFQIKGLKPDRKWELAPGQTREQFYTFDKAGTYGVYCYIANHHLMGMTGTLIVE